MYSNACLQREQRNRVPETLAALATVVLVGFVATSTRSHTVQLNTVSQTTTAATTTVGQPIPTAGQYGVPTMPSHAEVMPASPIDAEFQEVNTGSFTTEAPSQTPWIGMGIVGAVMGALATIFRPQAKLQQNLESVDLLKTPRRTVLASATAAAGALATMPQPAAAGLFGGETQADWSQIYIDGVTGEDFTFYDMDFFADNKHGFLIGSRQTLLETYDAGKTWKPRYLNTGDDLPYRYTSISFSGNEGWLVGKPAILMHTTDGGANWERIGLSPQLPGTPILVKALDDKGGAEMCTDQGGIYTTTTAAQTWKAAVEETVDATLNRTVSSGISGASYYTGSFGTVARNPDGSYLGVSSRGNFFMTWEPGQTYWFPHNRSGARRIQSMGFRPDGGLFEIGRGGQLSFSRGTGSEIEDGDFVPLKINTRGFGLLDVGWRDDNTLYAVGGSGTLTKSSDGGATWKRQKDTDDIAANLYEVKFYDNGKFGFVLGNSGVLLRTEA